VWIPSYDGESDNEDAQTDDDRHGHNNDGDHRCVHTNAPLKLDVSTAKTVYNQSAFY